ncbi:regulating synaptic membrane exocytosis protein 4 [Dasypus novemcinctus]|uniref:regulating synaptic membrane exocytosis protein 4 n=1 Tax=Dasypus novemcinctus TaxID=9361 RepID=UPI00265D81B0|nr:regulating synaptic membrane exocytosis protein 4 [Dasypus novemcinctus]
MERSQSRLSLSASFEALAIYFPCMNSFDDEDAGDSRRLKGAIQRSTETGLAVEMPSRTLRQASHESIEDSMNSYGSEGNLNYGGVCLASDAQFSDFLGSMGPAQFVGRQTLATTPMGDVEIGLQERNGQLEVDIIQARGLTAKPGSKTLPGMGTALPLVRGGSLALAHRHPGTLLSPGRDLEIQRETEPTLPVKTTHLAGKVRQSHVTLRRKMLPGAASSTPPPPVPLSVNSLRSQKKPPFLGGGDAFPGLPAGLSPG